MRIWTILCVWDSTWQWELSSTASCQHRSVLHSHARGEHHGHGQLQGDTGGHHCSVSWHTVNKLREPGNSDTTESEQWAAPTVRTPVLLIVTPRMSWPPSSIIPTHDLSNLRIFTWMSSHFHCLPCHGLLWGWLDWAHSVWVAVKKVSGV